MKLSSNNNLIWLLDLAVPIPSVALSAYNNTGLDVDSSNNIYTTFSSTFRKYSPSGNLLWAKSSTDPYQGCVVDKRNNINVVSASVQTQFNSGPYNTTVLQYDPLGNLLWTISTPNLGVTWDGPIDIAVDNSSNIGLFTKNICGPGPCKLDVVRKLNGTNGSILWSKSSTGCGTATCNSSVTLSSNMSIEMDNFGNIYLFGGGVQIDGIQGNTIRLSSSNGAPTSIAGPTPHIYWNSGAKNAAGLAYSISSSSNSLGVINRYSPYGSFELGGNGISSDGPIIEFDQLGSLYVIYASNAGASYNGPITNQSVPALEGNSRICIFKILP